jgi:hypothetical protein
MLPNSRPHNAVLIAGAAAVALWTAPPTQAHPIVLGSADITVGRARTVVRLAISAEDFLHFYDVRPDANDVVSAGQLREFARRHRHMMLTDFIVRDAAGARLAGHMHAIEPANFGRTALAIRDLARTRLTYTIHYETAQPPSHLSFQQLFGRSTRFVPSNIHSVLTQDRQPGSTTMRLTNGGNVETFAFDWDGGTPPVGPDAFNRIHATLATHDAHVDLELVIPLPVLETWMSIPRPDPDYVSVATRTRILPQLRRLVLEHNTMHLNEAQRPPEIIDLAFETLDGRVDNGASGRLSAWTGRARVRLRYTAPVPLTDIELTWTLFNNVVLAQTVDIHTPAGSTTRRLSTYAPTWTWSRAVPPR